MFIKNNYIYMYQFISGLNPDDETRTLDYDCIRDDEYSMDLLLDNGDMKLSLKLNPNDINKKISNILVEIADYTTETKRRLNDNINKIFVFNLPLYSPYPITKLLFQNDIHIVGIDGIFNTNNSSIYLNKDQYYLFGFDIKYIRVFFNYISPFINFEIPRSNKDLIDILRLIILNDKINIYDYTYSKYENFLFKYDLDYSIYINNIYDKNY